jgi:hypothetical protein
MPPGTEPPPPPLLPPPGLSLAVADQWLALWRLGAAAAFGGFVTLASAWDTRRLRSIWSANLTQAFDRTMRSPEFLELMAANLRALATLTRLTSQQQPRLK